MEKEGLKAWGQSEEELVSRGEAYLTKHQMTGLLEGLGVRRWLIVTTVQTALLLLSICPLPRPPHVRTLKIYLRTLGGQACTTVPV